ncbi:lipoprotein [Parendozoicomonas sp. Alg238-R29]|nr:lipoprotein [Parendozoicomonas sp. Alg238-R29]
MKRALALIAFSLFISACGQKGPLYLPDEEPSNLTVQGGERS